MIDVVYTGTRTPELAVEGVRLHHLPMLVSVPRPLPPDLSTRLRDGAHAVFYSKNAVEQAVASLGADPLRAAKSIWAVGRRTAAALEEATGRTVSTPEEQSFEGILTVIKKALPRDETIVSFELADTPRPLDEALPKHDVLSVATYETRAYDYDDLDGVLRKLGPRWVVFASPRAYHSFTSNLHHRSVGDNYRVCSIGPSTSRAIERAGGRVDHTAAEPDLESLLRELTEQ